MKTLVPFLLLAVVAHGAPATPPPATLSKEADLTTITLRPEAEARLRLKIVPVERRAVPSVRMFAGEVVRSLATADGRTAPVLGGSLDEKLRLAELQAVADGRVNAAQVQVEAAKIALERARKVRDAEAGSARSVDEASSALALAESARTTAQAQRALLGAAVEGAGGLWVRVAVYGGEAGALDGKADAGVRSLSAAGPAWRVQAVSGPATANAASATVDWYYELPAGATLRPGERVAVDIPAREAQVERLVVPFSAVVHDIHGGQWVYEAVAAHTYTRRRVQVARLAGGEAILASGPAAGAKIVTDGSAELFGTEFMTGK